MADRLEIDPYRNDHRRWGHSLLTLAEVVAGCLDAAGAKSAAEVGAGRGTSRVSCSNGLKARALA